MKIKDKILNILPSKIQKKIEPIYYNFQLLLSKYKFQLYGKKLDSYEIPIIINNYNRLEYLIRLIHSLKIRGYKNIYVLDNNSTYPPLLDFYKKTDVNIIYLERNWGFRAIWESGIVKRFWNSYYVYTDSDMEIEKECPDDFLGYFMRILEKYPKCFKVGFGLKISNIPVSFQHKNEVIAHEKQFWSKELEPGLYEASIDTTFALYRPYTGTSANSKKLCIRTGTPYLIKHLPWYIDSKNITDEEKFYINSVTQSTHWTKINKCDP